MGRGLAVSPPYPERYGSRNEVKLWSIRSPKVPPERRSRHDLLRATTGHAAAHAVVEAGG
jgi:hypothetical protein